MLRPVLLRLAAAAALALAGTAAPAQVAEIDPNTAFEEPAAPQAPAEPGWEPDEADYQPVDSGSQESVPGASRSFGSRTVCYVLEDQQVLRSLTLRSCPTPVRDPLPDPRRPPDQPKVVPVRR